MKIKPRIYSWSNELRPPLLSPINMIFERVSEHGSRFTNAALLYQDILKYAIEHTNGFTFTELGKWLINNNYDFRNYYTDSKARTTKSARLSNRRDTIQKHVDNLNKMDLIYEKAITKAKKNLSDIPLYDLTTEGRFLAWIIEGRDPHKGFDLAWFTGLGDEGIKEEHDKHDQKRHKALLKIFDIVDSFSNSKDSHILRFLSRFLRKCKEGGLFGEIVDLFYYMDLQIFQVMKGQELLRLFLKIRHPLTWIYVLPRIFFKTLDELNGETKKVMLFQFKMEIEEYYNKYYLVSYARRHGFVKSGNDSARYLYSNEMAVSGSQWQLMRINNLSNCNIIVIPGLCFNCKLECPFMLDTEDYLVHIGAAFISKNLSDLRRLFNSNCNRCGKKNTVIGEPYTPIDMIRGYDLL